MTKHFAILICCSCAFFLQILSASTLAANENWQAIDKQLKNSIYQLNVGIQLKFGDNQWVQLTGLSPKQHYYVFNTSTDDKGYQIVGHGSCFPVKAKEKLFFITSKHVLDNASETIAECKMFYAAMRLAAEKMSSSKSIDDRMKSLLDIVNLSSKQNASDAEKTMYANTVNSIWDLYDKKLSEQADPKRLLFKKYANSVKLLTKTAYFIHSPGAIKQPTIQGKVYKSGKVDLAILIALPITKQSMASLDLEALRPHLGEEIQAIGYPITNKNEQNKDLSPTFTNGTINRVNDSTFEFDASISKGNSGGPVINKKGKVVGIVESKLPCPGNNKQCNIGVAASARLIKVVAPELFN